MENWYYLNNWQCKSKTWDFIHDDLPLSLRILKYYQLSQKITSPSTFKKLKTNSLIFHRSSIKSFKFHSWNWLQVQWEHWFNCHVYIKCCNMFKFNNFSSSKNYFLHQYITYSVYFFKSDFFCILQTKKKPLIMTNTARKQNIKSCILKLYLIVLATLK